MIRALPDYPEEAQNIAETSAEVIATRFHSYVEFEDVRQEAYEWVVRRGPEEIHKILEPDDGEHTLTLQIRRHCERYARRERARQIGYLPGDEYFYSPTMIKDLLPFVLADNWQAEPPAKEADERVSGRRDPAEGGNWQATLADVAQAFKRLPQADRKVLADRFKRDLKLREIGLDHGDKDAAWVHRQIESAIKRLVTNLGGESPWN
jgi:hypothetical protein